MSEPDRQLLLAPVSTLPETEIIQRLQVTFYDLLIGEIRRTLAARIGVAAMVLACCAIDFLSSLWVRPGQPKPSFEDFVSEFMSKYDGKRLVVMRHLLVHNYTTRVGAYSFSVGRELASEHLHGSRIVVDLLVDDIELASRRLFQEVAQNSELEKALVKRLKKTGLVVAEPQDLVMEPRPRG